MTLRLPTSILWLVALVAACGGSDNLADCEKGLAVVPCSERTPEEEARLALDRGDFDRAIELLTQLVEEEPENYGRYTLLAAAHAARAEVAVVDIAMSSFSGGGGSAIDQVTAFLPDPSEVGAEAYALYVQDMGVALTWLKLIPDELRAETSSETYAKSAQLQLGIYSAAYSIMYLNQFIATAAGGGLDPAKLATMSEEDALTILSTLAEAGQLQASVGSPELAAKIDTTLTSVDAQPGSTQKEKLQNYVRTTKGGGAATSTATATSLGIMP
jgi:hypothetical protein